MPKVLLTAAGFVVESRGHEEALLGRSRRQGPLVRGKDGDHQGRELALDLLMREAGKEVDVGEGDEERKEEQFFKRHHVRHPLPTAFLFFFAIWKSSILPLVSFTDARKKEKKKTLTLTQLRAHPQAESHKTSQGFQDFKREGKERKKDFFDGWLWQGTTGESESEEKTKRRGRPREVGDRWLD